MTIEDSDPIDWGIDDVVAFLCNPESAPWAQSLNSARPDPSALEAALRENFISGEALLHDVDSDAIKHDLGVKALGHRSSLKRAIEWLRQRSPKYQLSKKSSSLDEVPTRTPQNEASSSHRSTPVPAPPHSVTPVFSKPPSLEALPVGTQNKRRIVPTLVSGADEVNKHPESASHPGDQAQNVDHSGSSSAADSPATGSGHFGDTSANPKNDKQTSVSVRTGANTVPPWFTPQLDKDLLQKYTSKLEEDLLRKYPPGKDDEDALPVYGDSGSENDYDSEGWAELAAERPEIAHEGPALPQAQSSVSLPRDTVESLVSRYIEEQEETWRKESLPKEVPYARPLWERSREGNNLDQLTKEISARLQSHSKRLGKLKKAILDCVYRSITSVRRSCPVLDQTLARIFLDKWRLSILQQDLCPPAIELPPKAPRRRKQRSSSVQSSETDGSEDLGVSSESNSLPADDDMSDFIVDDSDGDTEQAQLGASGDLPFTLASPMPSDSETPSERESASPAHKRPRIAETWEDIDPDADVEVIDLTGSKSQLIGEEDSAVPDAAQHNGDADEMEIATPPLNPMPTNVSQGADMTDDLPLGIDLLNSVSGSPPPDVPLHSHSETQDDNKRFSPKPREEPNNHGLNVNLDDIDLFTVLAKSSQRSVEATKNRIHLLAKCVMGLTETELKDFPPYLTQYIDFLYRESVQEALGAMLNNDLQVEGRDLRESKLAMRMGALFVSWHHCIALQPMGIDRNLVREALDAIADDRENMFETFLQKLRGFIAAVNVWFSKQLPHDLPHEDRGEVGPPSILKWRASSGKKKKSTVSSQQKEAQDRQARQEKAREALRRKREQEGLSNSDPAGQAVTFKEPIIYLHPHIGQFVKPHQLLGIQFMWRELIEADKPQGCLLAHVMGLGKTMQVISFLVTIAAATVSDDPKIREQVPQKFHRPQVLVLCPSPVVENWVDEFAIWPPEDNYLGAVRDIFPRGVQNEVDERVAAIKAWNDEGGVLIMSYEMFRMIIQNRTPRNAKPLEDEEHAKVEEWLLARPNIIVADEAHKLKNDKSTISQIASRFKSMTRIAITGSPLANHLSEYYQMVEWVAPGYLEDSGSFKSKFMDPIQAGSYMDSTVMQQRESLVALKLLNGILGPKVHRADTSAIASDLPSKTEFVLSVALTDLQKQAYDIFVNCLIENRNPDVSTKLWSWLALMQLCCNHPFPFREKLADRYKQSEYSESSDAETASVLPKSIKDAGLPGDLPRTIEDIFNSVSDLRDPSLSNRSLLLMQILDESLKVGDKVLIFSQSIPTMNYLNQLLKQCGHRFSRIDGSTPGADRQAASKRFNTSESERILLISTRAGGLGLNMFGANRVVIFDFLFNPTWEEQAVGRAYRLGQQKPVFVYRFVAGGTFEDIIFNNAVFKSQLAVRVVDQKNLVRESAKQRTRYLFPVQQVEKEDFVAVMGKDPQVLDKILTGNHSDCIIKASVSQIQDNENDRLTEAERQRVDDQLAMERLKRSDPEEYEKEIKRRHFAEIQRQQEEQREQQRLLHESQMAHPQQMMTNYWQHHQGSAQHYQQYYHWQQQQQEVLRNQQRLDNEMQQRREAQIRQAGLPPRPNVPFPAKPNHDVPDLFSSSTDPSLTAAPLVNQPRDTAPSNLSAPPMSTGPPSDTASANMDISNGEIERSSTTNARTT